jgi:RNA polymerase sigma-70 factor (ECF subfamily)
MDIETTFSEIGAREESTADFVMDEDAFSAFYERTARGLWAYLARVTGDRETANDLLQEAFYRFLRAGVAHESETHRRNSLYRIATNLARDARRRNLVRSVCGLAGDDIERVPSANGSGETERNADFERAMTRLKPRERAMLWLAYVEGASHSEIADALGLRQGSLKTMLLRARRKLAALMGRAMEGQAK